MSDFKFATLCLMAAAFLIASVVLSIFGKDGSGWGLMALISAGAVLYYA